MSTKSRRRAQRKAERLKKRIHRWAQVPADQYPFENRGQFQEFKSVEETQAIINEQRYLPWPVQKDKHPCRAWGIEDLWELGALKKAVLNEVEGLVGGWGEDGDGDGDGGIDGYEVRKREYEVKKREYEVRKREYVRYCLYHIFKCWRENILTYESAGPSFLIQMLKYTYEGQLGYDDLRNEDNVVAETICNAARKVKFHVILGKLKRYMAMVSGGQKYGADGSCVEYELSGLTHSGGQSVTIHPRVSEIDFLDEWAFESAEADEVDVHGRQMWHRTVLIVVPKNFIDDFIVPTPGGSDVDNDIEADLEEVEAIIRISNQSNSEDEEQTAEREEIFECIDEETMIEIAHKVETSGRELAEVHATYPENGSDVEVEDEAGNKYFMPASVFDS